MVEYENYEKIRNSRNMKDSDVARECGFHQSVLSDWKRGISKPKMDKMQKIAEVLNVGYFDLVGVVGKFSAYNPNRPESKPTEQELFDAELLRLFHNATPETQDNVILILKNSQKDTSMLSREA